MKWRRGMEVRFRSHMVIGRRYGSLTLWDTMLYEGDSRLFIQSVNGMGKYTYIRLMDEYGIPLGFHYSPEMLVSVEHDNNEDYRFLLRQEGF